VTVQADESKPDETAQPGLVRRKLFSDRWVCLLRADHPALAGKRKARTGRRARAALSLTTYATLSHVMVSATGQGQSLVDHALAQRGLTRRVALTIPHFYSALGIVARSDLVLTAPSALAQLASNDPSLIALPAPVPLPSHGVHLVWHERYANDRGHAWLRDVVIEVAQSTQRRAPALT
jgi:DNA-binding transcriptional LysR family regulator